MSKKSKHRANISPNGGVTPFPGPVPTLDQAVDALKVFDLTKTNDGYENFAARIGMMQNTQQAAGHYELTGLTKNRLQLEAAYRGSWVVGQVIDSKAEDMTRAGVQISTHEQADKIKDVQAGFSRLQILQSFKAGIQWGNLYGGAIGVIQIEGQDDATELNIDTIDKDQFQGLMIFDRWQISPDLNDPINEGPNRGLPKFYRLVTTPIGSDKNMQYGKAIHHSRVIRFMGIELPFNQAIVENMWGESVLERLWDRLIAFDNATMSSAALIDRANLRTVGVDKLREILATGGKAQQGLEAMFDMMRLLQNNQGLTLLDKEDTFQTTAYSFAGLSDMMIQFGQQLSGASGIPLVRLFGQSPAGLSATGEADMRMYYDNINAWQESKLRNAFEKIIGIVWRSLFGEAPPKDMTFTFTSLWQMSALDKSTIAKTNAETIIGVHGAGLMKASTAMEELRNDPSGTGLFSHITDEEIAEADELADQPPMPDANGNVQPDEEEKEPGAPKLSLVGDSDFKESDHPRAPDGKFGKGGAHGLTHLHEKAKSDVDKAHTARIESVEKHGFGSKEHRSAQTKVDKAEKAHRTLLNYGLQHEMASMIGSADPEHKNWQAAGEKSYAYLVKHFGKSKDSISPFEKIKLWLSNN